MMIKEVVFPNPDIRNKVFDFFKKNNRQKLAISTKNSNFAFGKMSPR